MQPMPISTLPLDQPGRRFVAPPSPRDTPSPATMGQNRIREVLDAPSATAEETLSLIEALFAHDSAEPGSQEWRMS